VIGFLPCCRSSQMPVCFFLQMRGGRFAGELNMQTGDVMRGRCGFETFAPSGRKAGSVGRLGIFSLHSLRYPSPTTKHKERKGC
jgi:hypothetical protein